MKTLSTPKHQFDFIDAWTYANTCFSKYKHDDQREPNSNFGIDKIIFNGPKTIIIWKDGTKTMVSCSENDKYNAYAGFCAAVAKKVFGSTSAAKKIVDDYGRSYEK